MILWLVGAIGLNRPSQINHNVTCANRPYLRLRQSLRLHFPARNLALAHDETSATENRTRAIIPSMRRSGNHFGKGESNKLERKLTMTTDYTDDADKKTNNYKPRNTMTPMKRLTKPKETSR